MSDHVKVLERFISEHKCGSIVAAIRAVLEENERFKTSLVEHFQREHIDGDGPEIDRWKARIDAALALHKRGMNPQNQLYCIECHRIGWPCHSPTIKALRGEK